MAEVEGPLYSIDGSGKIGDKVIFLQCPEGTFVQGVSPRNVPETETQWKNQAAISITNELYSLSEKADWQAWENRVGTDPLTGNNLFTSLANKAHHREVSFNVITAVKLIRISRHPDSTSHSSSSVLNSSTTPASSDSSSSSAENSSDLYSSSTKDSSDLYSPSAENSFRPDGLTASNPTPQALSPNLNSSQATSTVILSFKCRYDSLILISLWPEGSPPLSLPDHLPLPESTESGQPIQLSPGYLLIPFQARGWDDPAARRLDWNSWDWESWNQARENGNPRKIVSNSSAEGPLNQLEITGLQPGQDYYCRLTELPRLLTGPPDLTATIITAPNLTAAATRVPEPSNTRNDSSPLPQEAVPKETMPQETSLSADFSPSSSLYSEPNSQYRSNTDSPASISTTLDKNTPSDTLNEASPSSRHHQDPPQDYLTRAKIVLDSAPAALVYAVTCCLPGSEDNSISYVISQDSPDSLSPETCLKLNWQAMPEASCYNVYRTFSSAGLPCGFLGQTTSTSYQDQGQVIQNFSLPSGIKPCYLIDGDSGYYLLSN